MRIVLAAAAALALALPARAETPAPYADLPGTAWIAVEWGGMPPKPARVPRLAFGPSGDFSGGGGCNRFTGRYTVDGARIRLAASSWTKMMCQDDRMETDMRISADLGRIARLELAADGLLLARAQDGAVVFRFRRTQPNDKD